MNHIFTQYGALARARHHLAIDRLAAIGLPRPGGQMLVTAYGVVEAFPARADFTLADCAAAPALFYADQLVPIEQPRTRADLDRLLA